MNLNLYYLESLSLEVQWSGYLFSLSALPIPKLDVIASGSIRVNSLGFDINELSSMY